MPAEGVDEALLAELLARVVEGLGDAVGVEGQEVVGLETALADGALPLPEEPEHGRGRRQSLDGPVPTQRGEPRGGRSSRSGGRPSASW